MFDDQLGSDDRGHHTLREEEQQDELGDTLNKAHPPVIEAVNSELRVSRDIEADLAVLEGER